MESLRRQVAITEVVGLAVSQAAGFLFARIMAQGPDWLKVGQSECRQESALFK